MVNWTSANVATIDEDKIAELASYVYMMHWAGTNSHKLASYLTFRNYLATSVPQPHK